MSEFGVRVDAAAGRRDEHLLVSVIVPHFNDLDGLDRCLASLQAQTLASDVFEVIVADNDSPQGEDAVRAAIGDRGRLVVVHEKGAGPARNGGVAAAKGAVLAFIDCDCVAERPWLEAGLAAMPADGIAGGRVKVLVEDASRLAPAEAFEAVFAFDNRRYVEDLGFSVTANLFCPTALFHRIGGFRTGVSEDKEWCHRARAAGIAVIYAPKATVGHPARRSWDELVRKWRRLNAEAFALTREQPLGGLRWLARSLLLPASAVAHTPRVLLSPALRTPAQRWAALGVLYRLRLWRLWDALRLSAEPRRA